MASASGGNGPVVTERLFQEPWQFEFFQAVRLLEWIARENSAEAGASRRVPVGGDENPRDEIVHFREPATFRFSPSSVVRLEPGQQPSAPSEMHVAFLGLIGPSGVLPQHYTQLVIDRAKAKDLALRGFLDAFTHRTVSLFYRAWEKYRFYVGYERSALDEGPDSEDRFTGCLYALPGLKTGHLRGRLDVDDETFAYYAGHFAHYPRPAVVLEGMLGDHFEVRARVDQFCGQWLYLQKKDQSRLPARRLTEGLNNAVGVDVVVGERVRNVEAKFRVRLGPLTYRRFLEFTPMGKQLRPLCQFVRMFVGAEYDFDVQPVLLAAEVPECRLPSAPGSDSSVPPRLGWNTWLISRRPARDARDAVFVHEGLPSR
jgi:type VI secretion system protein ImpH